MAQQYQVDIVTKVTNLSSAAKLERALQGITAEQNKVTQLPLRLPMVYGHSIIQPGLLAPRQNAAAGVQNLGAAINAAAAKITVIVGAVQTFGRVMSTTFERQAAEQRLKNLTGSTEEYEAALLTAASVSQKFE